MSEGKLMVLLPHLLSGSAGDQYRADANGSSSGNAGAIIEWLEAVQNLLRTYATETAIGDAINKLIHD